MFHDQQATPRPALPCGEGTGYLEFHGRTAAAGVDPGPALATGTGPRSAEPLSVTVAADRHLLLSGRASWLITCRSGLVWITREGSLDDWVLRAGESRRLEGGSIVLGA